jgi:hypothetical protein
MRRKAEEAGTDLLVVDTGDRVEGAGLYDSSEPKGKYTADILKAQHIDVLSSGNHELYKKNTSENEYLITVPNFHGHYLASNIDIFDPKTGDRVPLAPRFRKFTTKVQGIRIVAFGFLFDFTDNYNNTVVQPVEETIKEAWFQEAIRDRDVDLFLVVGHVAVRSKEYNALFRAIRSVRWMVPIQFFGGHHHIRDYTRYDGTSYGLASGRFMETIGFASISGLSTGKDASKTAVRGPSSLSFSRRYIDNNLWSFYHHTGTNESTFPTDKGRNVSKAIADARSKLKLDHVHGCSPTDLWMSRAQYPSDDSIYSWLEEKVLPDTMHRSLRKGKSGMAIVNSGAIRFDIFKGPFTRDAAYIASPFTSGFRYTKDVPYEKAKMILEVLNKEPRIFVEGASGKISASSVLAPPEMAARHRDSVEVSGGRGGDQAPFLNPFASPDSKPTLIPGYTTADDGGKDGDDTIHSRIDFYRLPNCIGAYVPSSSSEKLTSTSSSTASGSKTTLPSDSPEPETVDLIYVDFIEPWIDVAAKFVGIDFDVEKDVHDFDPGATLLSLMVDWVEENWKCDDSD